MDIEVWRPVANWENSYEVSSFGRVRSKSRLIKYRDGRSFTSQEHILKGVLSKNGYLYVSIGNRPQPVHSLVLAAFAQKPPNVRTCNHKNGVKIDNRLTNLEWATYTENNRHARLLRLNKQDGIRCNLTKFSDDVVDAIRLLWPTRRFTQKEIGNLFNMSEIHVWEILNDKSRNFAGK